MRLGEGLFRPVPPPAPDPEPDLAVQVLGAVERLGELIAQLRPPEVHVSAPDLSDIVTAVNGLKPSVGAEEIADAIARRLKFPEPPPVGEPQWAPRLLDALEKLEFRLQGPAYGGGGGPGNDGIHSRLDASNALLDRVLRADSQQDARFDYVSRTDGQPVYAGKAAKGTATSADSWSVFKFTYDASDQCTLVVFASGSWDNRTSLF